MPWDDEAQRQRLIRALFANMDTWVETALAIADHPSPRGLALNHARNLLQCRQALANMLPPEDVPPLPDLNHRLPR